MASLALALLFASLALVSAEQDTCRDGSCEDVESLLVVARSKVKNGAELQAQHQSLTLSKELSDVAKTMPESATKSLFESFKICGQCSSWQRFGEPADGGYLMCMDGLKKGAVGAAYSLGVEHHDQWSEDVVKTLGISVNQFDCTVESSECQACKFYKKCVVAADGQHPVPGHEADGWSLKETLEKTGQGNAPTGSLLMKMDIESSEWPIYASEHKEVLSKFGQLIVEFHNLQEEDRHTEYLSAMQHILAAGFKVAHLHGNNYQGMYETGADKIPQVLEVTFVHGAARANGCLADQDYNILDAANNPTVAELPMAHMS